MLTLFTFKKVLFSSSIGTAIIAPIVATSPIIREFSWSSSSISPLKEGLQDFTKVDIYDGESVGSFLKKALLHKEGQEGLVESFAQELAKRWYLAQPKSWINSQIRSWDELHEAQFKKAWETLKPQNPQRDFWDNYWGSKESMNSYGLRFKSHELVQSFLMDFKQADFKINKQNNSGWNGELNNSNDWSKYFTGKYSFATKQELEQQDNWSKIGFFPTRVQSAENMWEKITLGKFEFINWVYKKWIEAKLPIYLWKVSWNYDTDAKEDNLKEIYNFAALGNHAPRSANYEFPAFSGKTLSKFKEFIKKIQQSSSSSSGSAQNGSTTSSTSLNLQEYHIPNWYNDQNTSGEIMELFEAFEIETPEMASALSYLVNKYSQSTTSDTKDTVSTNNLINKMSLNSDNNYDNIIELFLENTDKQDKSIEINSRIMKQNHISKFSYDVRETDSGWIFFRDSKGVHAIALDGHKSLKGAGSQNLTNWFNFRNLQTYIAMKTSMDHKDLISVKQDWFMMFAKFFKDNFNYLFSEYYIEKGSTSLLFKDLPIHHYFSNYKSALQNLFTFQKEQTFNSRLFKLRKKIIERYSGRDWELPSHLIAINKPKVAPKYGLSSIFPYSIKTEKNNPMRFPEQENVLSIFTKNDKKVEKVSADASPSLRGNNLLSHLEKYYAEVKKLLENQSINLKTRTNGFNFADSQRIFIQDPIFDFLLDKLFAQKEFLNYIVKEEKLLNSSFFEKNKLLGEKNRLDPSSGWSALLKLPPKPEVANNLQKTANESTDGVAATCKYTIEAESQKQEMQKLFSLLIKNYLFRNYLKKLDSDYFNFWIEFENYKRPTNNTSASEEGSTQQKLSDFELFSLWQNFALTDIKSKESLLDFLLSLDYLTKNKFENLKKFMTSQLENKNKYHYLFFDLKKIEEKNSEDKTVHPFLPTNTQNGNQKYFASRQELRTSIRENWKPSDNYKPEQISEQKGDSSPAETSFPLILNELKINQEQIPDKNKNLFNFSSIEGLIQYIKEVKSNREMDLLVTQLSLLNWKIYPSFYRADKIFHKQDDQKAKRVHQEKKLYLEDKKKALIYQIKNKDQSIYASKIFSKDEIEKMFAANLLENASITTAQTQEATSSQNQFDENLFKRHQGKIKGGYFIQIAQADFSDDERMCALFKMLPGELLGEFIIQQTDEAMNRQASQDKFFEEIPKLKIHDLKFKGHLDSRYTS
ncbi:DUF3713 domain-containing protein [Candidatus Mycoplasma haematominutum]|uniref:Conserved hypothetical prolipoprotein n=1 Tax=Candidatus Mycoplasma haematominutum 'Birmingham 1' TaxID=1116213 RepID=G8C2X7_9MOLU|nr:DUF3713 domain-containing protein [Candidatus Mycoplasma haematominutum]CCE66675.1 conserved hypothetical prolipoprotein [Candidatus Mycoplasma haematominutum 'Birmingham 1']